MQSIKSFPPPGVHSRQLLPTNMEKSILPGMCGPVIPPQPSPHLAMAGFLLIRQINPNFAIPAPPTGGRALLYQT